MSTTPCYISDAAMVTVERRPAVLSGFRPQGRYQVEHRNKDGELLGLYDLPNGIVDEGLNHILNTEFNSGTQITTWYIGLIDNSGFTALANSDVMSSHTGWSESSAYSNATRPAWTSGSASARSTTNATSVDFNINATATIKGIFISSNNVKGGTTGTLWSTAAFGSNVSVNNSDTLKITYTVSG